MFLSIFLLSSFPTSIPSGTFVYFVSFDLYCLCFSGQNCHWIILVPSVLILFLLAPHSPSLPRLHHRASLSSPLPPSSFHHHHRRFPPPRAPASSEAAPASSPPRSSRRPRPLPLRAGRFRFAGEASSSPPPALIHLLEKIRGEIRAGSV